MRATSTKIRTDASTVILETRGLLPLLAEVDRGHAAMYEPQRVRMHGIDGDEHEVAAAEPTNVVPHVELIPLVSRHLQHLYDPTARSLEQQEKFEPSRPDT